MAESQPLGTPLSTSIPVEYASKNLSTFVTSGHLNLSNDTHLLHCKVISRVEPVEVHAARDCQSVLVPTIP